MTPRFRNFKLKHKLLTIVMISCTTAMVLSSASYYIYDYFNLRDRLADDMTSQAMIVGENCKASLIFGDSKDTANTLASLRVNPAVIHAAIFTQSGDKLADYLREGATPPVTPYLNREDTHWFETGTVRIVRTIYLENEVNGYVYLVADMSQLQVLLRRNLLVVGIMSLVALIAAFLISNWMQSIISGPILKLARVANEVSRLGNYDMESIAHGDDEIGILINAFRNMLGEIRDREQSLKDSEEQFRMLFESSHDAIVLFDHETICGCNQSAVQQFRSRLKELFVGKPIHDFSPARQPDGTDSETALRDHLLEAQRQGGCRFEWMFQNTHRQTFYADVILSSMSVHRKQLLQAVVRDISQRKEYEDELQRARLDADQANSAKSDFLARMSHEIRTPMNGVMGMLDLLHKTQMNAKQLHYVKIARSSAGSLLSLINDILDFSKIEAGKLELDRIDFALDELIGKVTDVFTHRAADKGLELITYVHPDVPWVFHGDPDRIRQNLVNLIGNAMKFTETGEIMLEVSLAQQDDNGSLIRFSIKDSGIGIPPDRLATLFKAFSQAEASTTRKYGGTGLGLAITKSLAEIMGGSVGVESEAGKGSHFWFTVRLEPPHKPLATTSLRLVRSLQNVRILVVDDNATNREILKRQIEGWKCRVQTASSGQECLERLRLAAGQNDPFDFLITDMLMPNMNGIELAETIRTDPTHDPLTMIMLTSVDDLFTSEQYRRAGFHASLTKPVLQSELYNAIIRLVSGNHSTGQDETRPPEEAAPASTIRSCVLMAEDNEINQEVAREIIEQSGHHLDIVVNGREAVEAVMNHGYHLILMDCSMPDMDGFEATGAIRITENSGQKTAGGLNRIPIIALTANAIKGDREKCLAAGMDYYLTKPFNPVELLETIERYTLLSQQQGVRTRLDEQEPLAVSQNSPSLEKPALTDQPREPEAQSPEPSVPDSPTPPASHAPIDFDQFFGRCMKNPAFFEKMLDKFAARAETDLKQIMESADRHDQQQLALLAHALKGAAGNLSAEPLRQIAAELEIRGRTGEFEAIEGQLQALQAEIDRCLLYIPARKDYLKKVLNPSD